jgi:pimeloyl-ACP methyl ester carboxylesterase
MPDVVVNGVRLAYETQGDGPPVLMVGGTGQRAESWWIFGGQALLEAGYQVTVFDNRGMPPSDVPPPPYSVDGMAADAIGVIEQLGLGPCVVMGASLGGLITQRVALTRPDLVRAAIFLVGCGNFSKFASAWLSAHVKVLHAGIEFNDEERTVAVLQAMTPSPQWGDDATFDAVGAMASTLVFEDPQGELGQNEADVEWSRADHVAELAGLRVPALAIAGEYDWIFPPALVRQAVDRMPDGELVVIPGATHVAIDKIGEVNTAIVDFLARRLAPVGG